MASRLPQKLAAVLLLSRCAFFCQAAATSTSELQKDQCEEADAGDSVVGAANLMQVATENSGPGDNFGPGGCVNLKKSVSGSCVLRTRCKDVNISDTEFSFVCFNPGAAMPHALHSFGRGGFALEEVFDTKVRCKSCMSVDTAWRKGDSIVKNALAALPLSSLPSLTSAVNSEKIYSAQELASFTPKEAAVYGPSYCISTFLSPSGTCLIRTRCADVDLTKFNIGVTCIDKAGGYTRYLFGKDTFKPEETFDSLVTCQKCLGVGPESSLFAMHGLIPRKLVEDVSNLKTDLQTLNQKVRVLQDVSAPEPARSPGKRHNRHLQEMEQDIPTVMVSRGAEEGSQTAAMDVGPVQVVTHRRGAAIAELLKRAQG